MRSFFLYLVLFAYASPIYTQTISQTINKGVSLTEPNRWDLNKYLWSYPHTNSTKFNKPPLDFDAIDNWPGMGDYLTVSNNGSYFAYTIEKGCGLPGIYKKLDSLIVQSTNGAGWRHAFSGLQPGFFAANNKQYILQDKDTLFFFQLGANKFKVINNVRSYKTTNGTNNWMAYQLKGNDNSVILHNLVTGIDKQFSDVISYTFDNAKKWFICEIATPAKELIICDLESGKEQKFPVVRSYIFSPRGTRLLVNYGNELQYVNFADKTKHIIWTIKDSSDDLSAYQFDVSEKQVIFAVKDVSGATPGNVIWYYKEGMDKAIVKIDKQTPGIVSDIQIVSASFTDNGHYIQFSLWQKLTVLRPERDAVQLDVWSYKDSNMQSTQAYLLKQGNMYNAIIGIEEKRGILLDGEGKSLYVLQGDFAIVKKRSKDIRGDRFWESIDGHNEDSNWLVSLKDGGRRLLPAKIADQTLWFSTGGNYLVYFDKNQDCHYFSYNLHTGKITNISAGVTAGQLGYIDRYLRTDKKPDYSCGLAAWLEDDAGLLVYDNNDIWQLDLTGKTPAINLTNGYGRSNNIIFSLMNSERFGNTMPVLKAKEPLLLRTFNTSNKRNGFYRKLAGAAGDPELLSTGPHFMNIINWCQDPNISNTGMRPLKVKNVNAWVVQRQSDTDAPNYFETKDFKSFKRLTNFQPQQGHSWLSQELHTFKHLDGKSGQGILYKPADFDSSKKYPVLIIFYGGYSNNLYQFPVPSYNYNAITPGSSPNWFVNNGYLVFTPDIYVSPRKYGAEAFNVIEGAASYLKSLSYVDANGLGCCSHSWSAKLGAYLFTHSTSFGAMAISEGFLFGNMINEALSTDDNGVNQLDVVENGFHFGSFWENRDAWLEQTTVLNVDKATSPLLLLCNKKSTKEYQDQTLQLFTALRRLEKKTWWLKYDKGGHYLDDLNEQKDFTIRYTQYFDHYLKQGPAPKWMTQGIPASVRGMEERYALDPSGSCGNNCLICKKWNEQYKKQPAMFDGPISEWSLDNFK